MMFKSSGTGLVLPDTELIVGIVNGQNFLFFFYFILLYNTVLVLPYIDMNPP